MGSMRRFDGLSSVQRPFDLAVIALGNFDGVHRGHRVILRETVQRARRLGGTAVVYTFYPHPVTFFAPERSPRLIQTIDQRLEAFEALGIDACVVEGFSLNLAHQEPKDFFHSTLKEKLGAKELVVGYDFTFGIHRRGTVELLEHLGADAGIGVTAVDAQFYGELLISSTEIRRDIAAGRVEHAQELMGESFALRGTVIRGHGIGSTLGAHTANLNVENELLPAEGVYVTSTKLRDHGKIFPSITSVGLHPTFPEHEFSVETHLIDFDGDLVGDHLDILFHYHMRGQIAFDTPETLKGQIERDIITARRWHEEHKL